VAYQEDLLFNNKALEVGRVQLALDVKAARVPEVALVTMDNQY
jgi:hypothetical protein